MAEMYDLGIIGGGPAGYTAALHARSEGLSVVLFEKEKLGGVCLNRGCIPTKTILHCAEVYNELKNCTDLGIDVENCSLNFEKIIEHKEKTTEKLRRGLELAIKNAGITLVNSEAFLLNDKQIEAEDSVYNCKKIISAVGSEPRDIKGLEFDHEFILNSDDILNLRELPKSILIIGSGAIGVEWARILSTFDVDVTVVEAANNILPVADVEISKRLERIFKQKKIKFYTSTTVKKIQDKVLYLSSGDEISVEKILLAVGRKPCTDKKLGGVTYIGDDCGEIQLAHYAIKQAVSEIKGIKFDRNLIPAVVYGCPEIAWVGKREQDLDGEDYKKSTMLISALGKSHCDNCSEGIIKLLSQNDEIVGAHIISKEASALIQQILIAMQNNISVEKLKEICFAHPTYSEGIFESLFKL